MATKRKLFEEVGSDMPKPVATTGVIDAGRGGARLAIRADGRAAAAQCRRLGLGICEISRD